MSVCGRLRTWDAFPHKRAHLGYTALVEVHVTRTLVLSSLFATVALFGGVAVTAVACQTDSETPNAYFGRDGGPGDVGQPCRSGNSCNDITLACVDDDDTGPSPAVCLPTCLTTDNDPCGVGFLCVGLGAGTDGACVPAGALGEVCSGRCDDGLACIDDGTKAGTGVCEASAGEGEGEGE